MPTTSDGRWSPGDSDEWDLTTDLAAMQVSNMEATAAAINTASATLNESVRNGSPTVANQAARDALFPAPVQGNRVFRRDLGMEEAYFQAYNASTNPGGARTAGWYPTRRIFNASRVSGVQNLTAATWSYLTTSLTQTRNDGLGLFSGGTFTVTAPGSYRVSAAAQTTAAGSPNGIQITRNGTPDSAAVIAGGLVDAASRGGFTVSTVITLAAGDQLRVWVFPGNSANSIATGIGSGSTDFTIEKV